MSVNQLVRHRLGNGLRVVLAPDARVPVVAVSLWYAVGSAHERPGRSGFAHLFEHMMFQGSANVGKSQHFELIQAAGGRTNAYTDLDATVYSEQLPSHQLELALWLEADRMATLGVALSQETLDNQRDVVKNERRKRVDNLPYGTWEERSLALAFPPGHAYHHSPWGSMDELSAASLDDVRAFFATYYVPNNAVLVVTGDLEVDGTLQLIERHLGPIPPGADPPPPESTGPLHRPGPAREEVREDVPLPRLYVACRIPPLGDDGFDVGDLLSDLLTTGRASRLQAHLVRERRLAQSVESWTFPLVRGAALLLTEVTAREGVAPGDLEAALDEELDRLAAEAAPEEELARVRRQRQTRRAGNAEKAEERADRIGMYACQLDAPERFGTEDARDARIGPAEITAVAREWLARGKRAYLWYLPEG